MKNPIRGADHAQRRRRVPHPPFILVEAVIDPSSLRLRLRPAV
jgi:hypothetical protein